MFTRLSASTRRLFSRRNAYRFLFRVFLILLAVAGLGQPRSTSAFDRSSSKGAVAGEFPDQYLPQNLPDARLAEFFPKSWTTYASNQGRNAVFNLSASAPAILRKGVSWSFAGAGAIPLDGPPLNNSIITTAYAVGMPLGGEYAAFTILAILDGVVLGLVLAVVDRIGFPRQKRRAADED